MCMDLYYCLIYPFISYGNIVWASTYKTSVNSIFLSQKKIVRSVTNSSWDAHSAPLFRNLELLSIYDVNTLQIGTFVFQFFNNLLPSSFNSFFITRSQIHSHQTRSVDLLHRQFFRTNLGQFSIRDRGPVVWNSFPATLRKHSSLATFKKYLKMYLILKAYDNMINWMYAVLSFCLLVISLLCFFTFTQMYSHFCKMTL